MALLLLGVIVFYLVSLKDSTKILAARLHRYENLLDAARVHIQYNKYVLNLKLPYFAGYSTHLCIVRRYQYLYQKNTDSTHRWIVRTRVVSIYTVSLGCVRGMSSLLKAFRMWFNSAGDIRI